MNINIFPTAKNTHINFKGHEAQRLKGLVVQQTKTFNGDYLINELNSIAQQYKLNIIPSPISEVWTQDLFTITPKGSVIAESDEYKKIISTRLGIEQDNLSIEHEQGGNLFYVKNKKGKTLLLTGTDKFDSDNKVLKEKGKYQADKIVQIPKADFHLDLFLTPIGDNKILLADDRLMLGAIAKMINKVRAEQLKEGNSQKEQEHLNIAYFNLTKLYKKFKNEISENAFEPTNKAKTILEKEGFDVISVPSRIYDNFGRELGHKLNYSNAVTFKTENNETVLITGKSHLNDKMGLTEDIQQRIGMNFETIFVDSIKEHIKPENIHFVNGGETFDNDLDTILWNYGGGLHCMCAEIPQFDKEKE